MDFLSFYWRDVLDIALVTLLLYRILLLIRGTRAFSALIGLVVLVGGVRPLAFYRPLFLVMAAGRTCSVHCSLSS